MLTLNADHHGEKLKVFNLYRHIKTGRLYVVLSEEIYIEKTNEKAVLYAAVSDGKQWVRPHAEFHDGRFLHLNALEYLGHGAVKVYHDDSF